MTMTENMTPTKPAGTQPKAKGPVKTIRDETDKAIAANIWEREGQEGAMYYAYTISRSFKSKNSGKEGYSSDFHGRNTSLLARPPSFPCQGMLWRTICARQAC
jgi:hypothetical protein